MYVFEQVNLSILVAGLEALCAVRRKVQTVLSTGFRKKVNIVLGIR